MAYILRDYQQSAVDKSLEFFNDNIGTSNGGIVIAPTGAGKSLIISGIAAKVDSVLILQPRKELLEQNYAKYVSYGYKAAIYSASLKTKKIGQVTFATIGSIMKVKELFSHVDLIIIDECHFVNAKGGQYEEFLSTLKKPVIGLTATPFRMATNSFGTELRWITRTRPKIFSVVIDYIQVSDLLEREFLNPMKYFVYPLVDETKLRINSTGTDYKEASVKAYYDDINFNRLLIELVDKILDKRSRMLVFVRFIRDAEWLSKRTKNSAVVTSKTKPKQRAAIIEAFKNGFIKVVYNVGVLSVGFDYPELDTILYARETRSLALYYQSLGRGFRIAPNKPITWVFFVSEGTYNRFGRLENLEIVKEGRSKWMMRNSFTNVQLTNKYLEQ